jgi:prenyltransferase beta subunit
MHMRSAAARLQQADGGWSFDGGTQTSSDTNTTALMLQALIAAGDQSDARTRALAYLKSQQNADGGFPYAKGSSFGSDSDANSTALALQALVASGELPSNAPQTAGRAISALLLFQNPSGAFRYQAALPDDNDLATAQAIPAMWLKPFPIKRIATPVPAALPATAGEALPVWLVLLATGMLGMGAILRRHS